jgi:trehalose/maltose transport system substrate-binding protein
LGIRLAGSGSESLTCNALEWQFGEGGGRIVEDDRTVSVNNAAAIRSWERATRWIGSISPPAVVAYRERDSMGVFDAGNAAFNRLWLGRATLAACPSVRSAGEMESRTCPPASRAFPVALEHKLGPWEVPACPSLCVRLTLEKR